MIKLFKIFQKNLNSLKYEKLNEIILFETTN